MNKLQELILKRNELTAQYRAAAGEANPDMEKVERLAAELNTVINRIKTEEAIAASENGGTSPYSQSGEGRAFAGEDAKEKTRAAFNNYIRTGNEAELRALTTGKTGGATGGYLVPEEWENRILEAEREMFVMRQLADVQTSETNNNIPVAATVGTSVWLAEGAAFTESDPAFDTVFLTAYKVGRVCKVSTELLEDNAYNLEGWLTNAFAYSNGLAMETAYITGDGSGKPKGFIPDANEIVSAGTAIVYDDLLKLFAGLKPGYYSNATWLMNTGTLVELMKLKDTSGKYLYQPFDPKLSTEPLGQILGRPVKISSAMPVIAANAKPIAFGDFKHYRIQDRKGFVIERLDELYRASGMRGFLGEQRTDGRLLMPEAIKCLKVKAGT